MTPFTGNWRRGRRSGAMQVSVILAVRNGEQYLATALDSVFAQDLPAAEVIVVDGQSTDSTAATARSYPGVRYLWQEGRGVADAWNTGIAAATGELIAFMSHDDLWLPQKLSHQVKFMQDHPDLQYTITLVRYFLQEGQTPPPGFRRELLSAEPAGLCMETLMARRSVFDRIGGFDESFQPVGEDTDWFARAIDSGIQMAVVPEVLLEKRVHNESTVATSMQQQNRLLRRAVRSAIDRKHARRRTAEA